MSDYIKCPRTQSTEYTLCEWSVNGDTSRIEKINHPLRDEMIKFIKSDYSDVVKYYCIITDGRKYIDGVELFEGKIEAIGCKKCREFKYTDTEDTEWIKNHTCKKILTNEEINELYNGKPLKYNFKNEILGEGE